MNRLHFPRARLGWLTAAVLALVMIPQILPAQSRETPQRIVTAGRAVLMIADVLYAFEEAPQHLVGVGRIRQGRGSFPAAIDPNYDRLTILEQSVGPEQVAALRPDLVILKAFMRDSLGRPLERLGIPVHYVDLETPEDYRRDLRSLGRVLREAERAGELVRFFDSRTQRIESRTAILHADDRPRVLLISHRVTDGGVAFEVPPDSWIQTTMVELAGGTPVWRGTNPGGGWATVSFEQIAAWDPDQIMLVDYGAESAALRDRLAEEPRFQALRAVHGGRFHAVPADFYSWDQPDTRWILGLTWMATRINPGLFRDIDIESETRTFFRELYGLDDAEFESIIQPVLQGDLD